MGLHATFHNFGFWKSFDGYNPTRARKHYHSPEFGSGNQFSGNLPPELGNLTQIERLLLNSNNFTGELPTTLANLTALREFGICDNQFSGKIPDFIQNWKSLERMRIQGSGLSGPIPSAISLLENLTELIISDLNGSEYSAPLPELGKIRKLERLILRNCNINGTIPEYLGNMTAIKTIDLSFNKLSGHVPNSFANLKREYIFLTENLLDGPIPPWIGNAPETIDIDLSYNNFSVDSSGQQACSKENVNIFTNSSTGDLGKPVCSRSSSCSRRWRSLYINCGGTVATVSGNKAYEDDSNKAGPARFLQPGENWALSTTGYYLDSTANSNKLVYSNGSRLSKIDAQLYMNARVSPISLTYYGFCLENGNYRVNLHFAEIVFTDDQTYGSLGRRIFDVYIQGKLVLKNFNIAEEAGGFGKAITRPFPTVVTGNTLEIRLYWAGKGTTAIPFKSVYGPLISAITVDSDFGENGISPGAVAGIVAAGVVIVILVFGVLWWRGCIGPRSPLAKDLKGLDLKTGIFTLRDIKAATNNFNAANKIGEGGFGSVYKGILPNGTMIAVKQLSAKSRQGNREFINEIGMISALQHPCLVKLYGCCVDGDQLLLIYEFMDNNSLARALFGPEEFQLKMDWPTRHKICVGIARGLAYIHEESRLKIVHRDIKATNVLLDKDLNPKISDFGLAKLVEEDDTHISTRIAGTYGYMAPEYAMHGYLTDKADIYSFGIVALEIVSGKSNTIHLAREEAFYLLDWARLLKQKGKLMELVDRRLGSDLDKEGAMMMIQVGLLCTNVSPAHRPTMSTVVSILEGKSVVEEIVTESSDVLDEKKLEMMRMYYNEIEENRMTEIQGPSTSSADEPFASSTSATDLYPLHLDSSYWDKRS
ncbi:probable leucine-rich repeat receptor-like serine/threonine-protein kinase At3g14840 isoform X2 [Prosopis cineraria]|uniref:probable leucine-rich repeat receptor-like serine/threonine-protein kinase At3g14840 isoform X2 n=1 Tax=Prosopis cineraria TaxID=364024 RepID=UPI00240EBADB|nr:probable leucine-rich repeat receptor-like serine/threonine-protein kinase At3g14840 isoform X2 [Prosopis cineraria]